MLTNLSRAFSSLSHPIPTAKTKNLPTLSYKINMNRVCHVCLLFIYNVSNSMNIIHTNYFFYRVLQDCKEKKMY